MKIVSYLFTALLIALAVLRVGLVICKEVNRWQPTPVRQYSQRPGAKWPLVSEATRAELDSLSRTYPQAQAAAEAFQQALHEGRTADAYSITSAAFKNRYNLQSFTDLVRGRPVLCGRLHAGKGYSSSNLGKHEHFVEFRESAGQKQKSFAVTVVPEANGYRIADISFADER